jgi:hypothetical protein
VKDSNYAPQDLTDFFSVIGEAKRTKKKKLEEIVSNSFDEFFWEPLVSDLDTKVPKNSNVDIDISENLECEVEDYTPPSTNLLIAKYLIK